MWFLLGYLFGRRRRRRAQPAVAFLGLTFAFVGVLIGGFWVGVLAAMVALVLFAAASA